MKIVATSSWGLLLVVTSVCANSSRDLAVANVDDLRSTVGGACEKCAVNTGVDCTKTTCTANGKGKWYKKAATLITVQKCAAVAKDERGHDKCTLSTKQDCHTHSDCTDDKCAKCTTIATPEADKYNTKCSTAGGRSCKGK